MVQFTCQKPDKNLESIVRQVKKLCVPRVSSDSSDVSVFDDSNVKSVRSRVEIETRIYSPIFTGVAFCWSHAAHFACSRSHPAEKKERSFFTRGMSFPGYAVATASFQQYNNCLLHKLNLDLSEHRDKETVKTCDMAQIKLATCNFKNDRKLAPEAGVVCLFTCDHGPLAAAGARPIAVLESAVMRTRHTLLTHNTPNIDFLHEFYFSCRISESTHNVGKITSTWNCCRSWR